PFSGASTVVKVRGTNEHAARQRGVPLLPPHHGTDEMTGRPAAVAWGARRLRQLFAGKHVWATATRCDRLRDRSGQSHRADFRAGGGDAAERSAPHPTGSHAAPAAGVRSRPRRASTASVNASPRFRECQTARLTFA